MDDRILTHLLAHTPESDLKEAIETVMAMRCSVTDPVPLPEAALYEALKRPGGYLLLKARYEDLEREIGEQKIKRKLSEAAAVVTVYEEDGASLPHIENFARYIHGLSDPLQHSVFGVKRVEKLSEHPVRILFAGILPINRLRMRLGRGLADLIAHHPDHFVPRFAQIREALSQALGFPILPLFPDTDPSLPPGRAELYDPLSGDSICRFDVENPDTPESLERYLARLVKVYTVLGTQTRRQLEKGAA
ncbi:MAG: hypothetical protein GXO33_04705 [Epsilonproteobacteria bacterium]|nr:hypothetical protein [Campylobacterota bacterium]